MLDDKQYQEKITALEAENKELKEENRKLTISEADALATNTELQSQLARLQGEKT